MTNTPYDVLKERLKRETFKWLITGVAGFIGSNLLEALLKLNQKVVGLDNFSAGHRVNLDDVRRCVGEELWSNFLLIQGDICNLDTCTSAIQGVDYVLHHAAIGSVPWSIEDPIFTNTNNVNGFLNILLVAREYKVKRLVYATSSAVYGDNIESPKVEDRIGRPLSPYAVTKHINELYAEVFANVYNLSVIGLRYFNVFGPRQDPLGAYAAVIPKWTGEMIAGRPIKIHGDGETTRDFCYIEDVIQANILSSLANVVREKHQVFNVGSGESITLKELFNMLRVAIIGCSSGFQVEDPEYGEFRIGDVRHSTAEISKISQNLKYSPRLVRQQAFQITVDWYVQRATMYVEC